MFIYIEIVKTERYQREKIKISLIIMIKISIIKKENKRQKSTALGIPRRSPIQVLTGLDVARTRIGIFNVIGP